MSDRITNPHTLRFDPAFVDQPVECWRVEWLSEEGGGQFTRHETFDTETDALRFETTLNRKSRVFPFTDWQPRMTPERFAVVVATERAAGLAYVAELGAAALARLQLRFDPGQVGV